MRNIKSTIYVLLFAVIQVSPFSANAEIPKTPQYKDYAHLLKRSPFKIKLNKMVEKVAPPKPSTDYRLRGVTQLEDKWMIVVVDRRKPTENIIIKQGSKNSANLELIDVVQNLEDYKLTSAKLKVNNKTITVNYSKSDLKSVTTYVPPKSAPRKKSSSRAPVKTALSEEEQMLKELETSMLEASEGNNPSPADAGTLRKKRTRRRLVIPRKRPSLE